MIGAGAVLGFGGQALASLPLRVERRTLKLRDWKANGFRVAVLADTHVDTPKARDLLRDACLKIVEERPDLVVHVGDYTTKADIEKYRWLIEATAPLRDYGGPKVAVRGNHDLGPFERDNLETVLKDAGFRLLRNAAADVGGVTVLGVDDALFGEARWDQFRDQDYGPSVLSLMHEPDFIGQMPRAVGLQISGHSHGGQVCLPGGFAMKTPLGARRYVAGFYPEAVSPVYVSRGIGVSGLQFRLYCPPEVSLLTLVGSES